MDRLASTQGVANHVAIAIFRKRGDTKVEAYRIDRFGSVDGIVLRSSEDSQLGPRRQPVAGSSIPASTAIARLFA